MLKLKSFFVLVKHFWLENVAWWANFYVKMYSSMSQNYYSWNVLLVWCILIAHCLLYSNYKLLTWISSFSSCALHYYLIKIMLVACQFKNYLCYRLPTRGRVGTKLGGADTSQIYLYFFVSFLFYTWYYMFYLRRKRFPPILTIFSV